MTHHIELYITISNSGDPYKCDIINKKSVWKCTLYQENFRYEVIKDSNLTGCFEKIAAYLDSLGYVTKIEGNHKADMYIAILQSHLMIIRSNRTLNKNHGQDGVA
ncbi:MAG TPA: hypothetical protein VGB50_00180 [Flavobacterium sp.]|jgi:hypothetical protein